MDNFSADLITLLRSASGLAQAVLVLLLGMSILSWGIIIEKWWTLQRAKKARRQIQNISIHKFDPDELRLKLDRLQQALISKVYHRVYLEYFSAHRQENDEETLSRLLQRQGAEEISRMEARIGVLATVGSVSPFIGLFGTVWGVMRAFMNIGTWGSTSLAVVAPGIAEALIATAAGLAAAIPAVIFYNSFLGRLRDESRALEQFSTDLILAERKRRARQAVVTGSMRE